MLSLLCVPDSFLQTDSKVNFRGKKKSDRGVGWTQLSLCQRAEGMAGRGSVLSPHSQWDQAGTHQQWPTEAGEIFLRISCSEANNSHSASCCGGLAPRNKRGRCTSLTKGAGCKCTHTELGEDSGSSPEQELMNKPYHGQNSIERLCGGL